MLKYYQNKKQKIKIADFVKGIWLKFMARSNKAKRKTSPDYLKTPMLFALGFIFMFVGGGITGIILSHGGIDKLLHDTIAVLEHDIHNLTVDSFTKIYF